MVRKELKVAGNGKTTSIVIGHGLPIDLNVEKFFETANTLALLHDDQASLSKPKYVVQTREMAKKEKNVVSMEETNDKEHDEHVKNVIVPVKESDSKDQDDQVKNDIAIAQVLLGLVRNVDNYAS